MQRMLLVLSMLLLVSGCATIIEGTSQDVTVTTNPPAAQCAVDRVRTRLATVGATPAQVHIGKSGDPLTVTCQKPGYLTASVTQAPKFKLTTFGNVVAGGLIGVAVDASSGANYAYPSEIALLLQPDPRAARVAALPAAPIGDVQVTPAGYVQPAPIQATPVSLQVQPDAYASEPPLPPFDGGSYTRATRPLPPPAPNNPFR